MVVQALVAPRAAGVLFTRHPDAGDPSRLLLTANYGLGEVSVTHVFPIGWSGLLVLGNLTSKLGVVVSIPAREQTFI